MKTHVYSHYKMLIGKLLTHPKRHHFLFLFFFSISFSVALFIYFFSLDCFYVYVFCIPHMGGGGSRLWSVFNWLCKKTALGLRILRGRPAHDQPSGLQPDPAHRLNNNNWFLRYHLFWVFSHCFLEAGALNCHVVQLRLAWVVCPVVAAAMEAK